MREAEFIISGAVVVIKIYDTYKNGWAKPAETILIQLGLEESFRTDYSDLEVKPWIRPYRDGAGNPFYALFEEHPTTTDAPE